MSDNLDHLIADVFVQFDAAERGSYVPAPGLAAVRQTVARRRRIRNTSVGVLAAVVAAVPATLLIIAPHRGDAPPTVVGSTGPTATAAPTSTPSPSPSPTATTPATLLNATLTLPAFPGLANECGGAGSRTFVDGVARGSGSVTWTIGAMVPIEADLDGKAGDELLTTIGCDTDGSVHARQLLALKVGATGSLSALGYVVNSPDVSNLAFRGDEVSVEAKTVMVTTSGPWQSDGWPACYHQVRGYAYQRGAFTQVSGPTSFPHPPNDLHKVDFRNAGLLVSIADPAGGGGSVYCVPMANGTGATGVYVDGDPNKGSVPTTFSLSGPVSFITDSFQTESAVVIVTYRSETGPAIQSVQLFTLDAGGSIVGQVVQRSGLDAVTSIEKVEVSGGKLVVTLTAGGTSQAWTYSQSAESGVWQHVS